MTAATKPHNQQLDQIIDGLMQDGRKVSEGEFSMERAKAREKMEKFFMTSLPSEGSGPAAWLWEPPRPALKLCLNGRKTERSPVDQYDRDLCTPPSSAEWPRK